MKYCPLALVLACCASTSAQWTVAAYGTVASVCTARKQELVDKADTPVTPPQEAAYTATQHICQEILDEIERQSKAQ